MHCYLMIRTRNKKVSWMILAVGVKVVRDVLKPRSTVQLLLTNFNQTTKLCLQLTYHSLNT